MPSTGDTAYSARLPLPDLIERGADNTLSCPMYRDGALVAPASGLFYLYKPNGEAIIDGAVVVVSGDVATYGYFPATTVDLAEGYRVEWALDMPDSITHRVRNEAAVVRRRLYCPITDADLHRVFSGLDPSDDNSITAKTHLQDHIDEGWVQVQLRLIEMGNRPNLVVSPSALRQVTMHTVLALVFDDFASRLGTDGYYAQLSETHHERAEQGWKRLSLTYADGDDDTFNPHRKRSGWQSVWLGKG